MERSTVVRKSISAKQPMFNVIEPPPPPPPYMFPASTTAVNIDASFSSYLNPPLKDPTNLKITNNQPVDSEISIFDAQKYFNDGAGDPKMRKRVSPINNSVNPEYFASVPRLSSASSSVDGYGRNYRARSFHATPTASSEASWNSQTGLLANPPGAISVSMRNPGDQDKAKKGSGTKWLLGRRCPCSGKKSVQVEDNLSESQPPRTPARSVQSSRPAHRRYSTNNIPDHVLDQSSVDQSSVTSEFWHERQEIIEVPRTQRISADTNRFPLSTNHQNQFQHRRVVAAPPRPFGDGVTNGFTFPILSQSTTTPPPIKLVLNEIQSTNFATNPSLEEPPRDSLEVFRPPTDDSIPIKSNPEITHRRPSFTFPASPKSRMAIVDDDIASDASSDLFEIESFSTQTTSYNMYTTTATTRRDSLDEASSFNARRNIYRGSMDEQLSITEGYEPSEASIDWSVTTAEGFDKASVTNYSVSEAEEMLTTRYSHHHAEGGKKKRTSGGGGGGGNGGLLSCRCEKAVSVGPNPVKCVGNEGQRGGNGTLKHVSQRAPQKTVPSSLPVVNKPHTTRLSMPFVA